MAQGSEKRNAGNALPRSNLPAHTAEDLNGKLRRYDRTPFIDVLEEWMQCMPATEDIRAYAKKSPGKWIDGMATLSRLAGFTEKQQVDHTHTINFQSLSDSQLEDEIKKLSEQGPILDLIALKQEGQGPHGSEGQDEIAQGNEGETQENENSVEPHSSGPDEA